LRLVDLGCLGVGEDDGPRFPLDDHCDPGHVGGGHVTGQLCHPQQGVAEGAIVDEELREGEERFTLRTGGVDQ
jgi:hypothetical protein